MSYAFATQIFMLVPVVGVLVAIAWMLIVEAIAIREAHRTSMLVATVSVLGFRVLFYGGIVTAYAVLVGTALMAASRGG